jgi:hypothetical protein
MLGRHRGALPNDRIQERERNLAGRLVQICAVCSGNLSYTTASFEAVAPVYQSSFRELAPSDIDLRTAALRRKFALQLDVLNKMDVEALSAAGVSEFLCGGA